MNRRQHWRTRLALRIAPWVVYEIPMQELGAVEASIPESERGSATHSLIKTFLSGYRRQAEEANHE